MPQQVVNEIHGALHAPDNPVIPMSGYLRSDLLVDALDCEVRDFDRAHLPWVTCEPHAHQPWAVRDPHTRLPCALCDHCLAGSG